MEVVDIFERHKSLLKILGVTIPEKNEKRSIWMRMYFSLLLSAFTFNSVCQMYMFFLPGVNMADRAIALVCFFVSSVAGFKLYVTQSKYKELIYLFKALNSPGAGSSTFVLRKVNIIHKAYTVSLCLLLGGWVAYPFLIRQLKLPVPYWVPFRVETFWERLGLFSFVTGTMAFACAAHEGVDTLLLLIAGQICRRFDCVNSTLLTIGKYQPLIRGKWKGKKDLAYDPMGLAILKDATMSRDETLLKECIREHGDVIKYVICNKLVRVMDEILDVIFFVQVIQSTVVNVMTYFAVFQLENPVDDLPKFSLILMATYLQFYMYCWIGEEISFHSDDLHKAVYCSGWYKCNRRVLKSIVIMETFTKTRFKLEGGHLFQMGFRTFLLVIEESFSYFMVLRAVTK